MKKSEDPEWVGVHKILYPIMYTVSDRYVHTYSIEMIAIRVSVDVQRISKQT